jgi:hypothetical protein
LSAHWDLQVVTIYALGYVLHRRSSQSKSSLNVVWRCLPHADTGHEKEKEGKNTSFSLVQPEQLPILQSDQSLVTCHFASTNRKGKKTLLFPKSGPKTCSCAMQGDRRVLHAEEIKLKSFREMILLQVHLQQPCYDFCLF